MPPMCKFCDGTGETVVETVFSGTDANGQVYEREESAKITCTACGGTRLEG